MTDILDKILAQRVEDIVAVRASVSLAELALRTQTRYPAAPLDLYDVVSGQVGQVIAAEFKRASPSKGDIAHPDLDASVQLGAYISGGAALLSVLTEPKWFRGSLADMELARGLADAHAAAHGGRRPAVLRKDFVVDAYQLAEARAWGADTALLIVNALAAGQLAPLIAAARALGMEPLVEVCSVQELDAALAAGAVVIGVNNRNLRTFTLDMGTTAAVVAAALQRRDATAAAATGPAGRSPVVLSLSGIKEAADLRRMVEDCARRAAAVAGEPRGPRLGACVRGFLIGEALMRSADPAGMVRALVSAGQDAHAFLSGADDSNNADAGAEHVSREAASSMQQQHMAAKICGVRDPGAAVFAARHGASFIGVILVPGSARFVPPEDARAISDALRAFREHADPDPALRAAAHAAEAPRPTLRDAVGRLATSTAALCAAARRTRPLLVGVCMDQTRDAVAAASAAAGVDVVQLHGRERAADFGAFALPLIKVLHVPPLSAATAGAGPAQAEAIVADIVEWSDVAVAVLLDSGSAAAPTGGLGLLFDHDAALTAIEGAMAARLAAEDLYSAPMTLPVLLAGGLTPDNVSGVLLRLKQRRTAIADSTTGSGTSSGSAVRVTPCVLDVSSGVEGAVKGVKDEGRVAAFLTHVLHQ